MARCVKLKINEDKRRMKRIEEITNLTVLSCMLKKKMKNEKRKKNSHVEMKLQVEVERQRKSKNRFVLSNSFFPKEDRWMGEKV